MASLSVSWRRKMNSQGSMRVAGLFMLVLLSSLSAAQSVSVTVTNNQPNGGFSFSPTWFAFHDGTFDTFNSGAAASLGVERIAELGDASALRAQFGASADGVDSVVMS